MSSSPWASHSSKPTPVSLRHASDDITMGGMKSEYLVEPVPNLQTATPAPPEFSQPRSMPPVTAMNVGSSLCVSEINTSSVPWPAGASIVTANSQGGFSSPAIISRNNPRPMALSSGGWTAPMDPTTSRAMPPSVMATGGYPLTYGYSSSIPQAYSSIYQDEPTVGIPGYEDHPALYGSHIPTPAMRSLSPQLVVGQSSGTLVTAPTPLPDRVVNPLPCSLEPTSRLGMLAQDLMPVSLSREARSALPSYIDIFWDKVHPLYPIIHRSTVEDGTDVTPEHVDVLRCAMAAVATQFLGHREHRVNGSQLHAYAWHKSKTVSNLFPFCFCVY